MLRYELPIWRIRSYMYFAGLGIHGLVQRAGFDHLRWSKTQSGLRWARLHRTYGKKQHTPGLRKWSGVKIFTWSCQDLRVMIDWCTKCVSAVFKPFAGWRLLFFFTTQIYPIYLALSQSILGDCLPNKRCVRCQHCEPFGPLPRWRQR